MNDGGKSDKSIVPTKPTNKGDGQPRPTEWAEGRDLAKGNPGEQTRFWTQGQVDLPHALERIRKAARRDKGLRFTALWHHVYNVNRLRQAYYAIKRDASAGVDRVTWRTYGEDLERNLKDLSGRLQRGAYRAKPVKRAYIPKADGGQRPIGITTLEDKVVQRATVEVLNAVYETDFKGFSYGFRPGRNQHNALDAVTVAIEQHKVSWVLDADIRGFFDTLDHEWLIRFVEHRIGDRRVVRHIKKWLNAGVLEEGDWRQVEQGVPQGGSVSPLLANIYLHHALDLWVDQWRHHHADGEVYIVRYADDFIIGFQYRRDGEQCLEALRARLAKFNLELHSDKTRLIEFGRFAGKDRNRRGGGKPETFDFLGFTHICGTTRQGKFCVRRKTKANKVKAKLAEIKAQLRRRLHAPVPETGTWLKAVLTGHYRYYGVPRNYRALSAFRWRVVHLWRRSLSRRSGKSRITWEKMGQLEQRWLPRPRIMHPYPSQRLCVTT